MIKIRFTMKTLTLSVVMALSSPYIWASDVSCDTSTGCAYQFIHPNWKQENQLVTTDKELNVKAKAQDYRNSPVSKNDYPMNSDGTVRTDISGQVFGILNVSTDDAVKSHLHIPAGTSITVENGLPITSVYVYQTNVVLEKGVKITQGVSTPEKEKMSLPQGEEYDSGHAVDARDGSNIQTSADIEMSGTGGIALLMENSTLQANNHQITLNRFNNGIDLVGQSQAEINQVQVIGHREWNQGVSISSIIDTQEMKPTVHIRNSTITLNGENSIALHNQGGSIHADNLTVNAPYAISSMTGDDDDLTDMDFSLKNSNITGSKNLIALNPDFWVKVLDDDEQANALNQNKNLNIQADNSTLTGVSSLNRHANALGKVNLNLSNNSVWHIQDNSEIDDLHLSQSTVNIGKSNGFNVLTINGNLSGNGTFLMNSDIAGGKSDLLDVKGTVSGQHILDIHNTKTEPSHTNGKIPVAHTVNSANDSFRLKNGVVEAGKYLYTLQKEGQNWQLVYDNTQATNTSTNSNITTAVPNTPNQSTNTSVSNSPVVSSTHTSHPTIPSVMIAPTTSQPINAPNSPSVNKNFRYDLMESIANAQMAILGVHTLNESLNKRQMDLHQESRLNGLWIKGGYYQTHRPNRTVNDGTSSGFKEKSNVWQLGYDVQLENSYVGILAGQGRHHINYHIDLYDDSHIRSHTFAIYGGLNNEKGWFVDGTLRHSRYSSDNRQVGRSHVRMNSMNIQGGKNWTLNENWSVVPNLALTVGHLSGGQLMQNSTLFQTRLGFDLKGKWLSGNTVIQPKLGIYYLGDYRGADVQFNDETFRTPKAGHRVGMKLGAGIDFSDKNQFTVDLKTEYGREVKRAYGVELGYRYRF